MSLHTASDFDQNQSDVATSEQKINLAEVKFRRSWPLAFRQHMFPYTKWVASATLASLDTKICSSNFYFNCHCKGKRKKENSDHCNEAALKMFPHNSAVTYQNKLGCTLLQTRCNDSWRIPLVEQKHPKAP